MLYSIPDEIEIRLQPSICPNCGGSTIADPDDESDFFMCVECDTLINDDGSELDMDEYFGTYKAHEPPIM